MRKFIHSNFQLDLSTYNITDTAENPWFSGNYFTKYSYPFELPLTPDNDESFGFISHYNSAGVQTLFEGIYVHGNNMEKAILEVEECEKSLSVTIRYGLDDFPNFDKKLAELPLDKFTVPNIYQHADAVVAQTWPAVNYNFPQVHIDKIETEDSDVWFAFEKIINNYKAGHMLVNEVSADDITYNRNIIQPLPYLLHIIKAGINAAGFTLHGDILQDADLQKTLIYTDVQYFREVSQESLSLMIGALDYVNAFPVQGDSWGANYFKRLDIVTPGKYKIVGGATLNGFSEDPKVYIVIRYRSQVIFYREIYTWDPAEAHITLDFPFSTAADLDPHFLIFEIFSRIIESDIMLEIQVHPIVLYNDQGQAVPTIQNLNEVDLTRAVPDILFGDLIKIVLAAKNMDIDPRGTEIWINFVENEIKNREIVDLSMHDVKFPKRKFFKGNSFLLKYADVESEVYKYTQIFQDNNGIKTLNIKTNEKTAETAINALPLPQLLRSNVMTAHGFASDNSKPFFVMYNGLTGGLNLTIDNSNLLIPYLHEKHHRNWMAARIDSQAFTWTLYAYYEDLIGLTAKSRLHAFSNIMIAKSVQKTEISPDLFEVEIEAEIFK
jgi:hypothetical protein